MKNLSNFLTSETVDGEGSKNQSEKPNPSQQDLALELRLASRLLAQLAPLFPQIAAMTKHKAGTDAWLNSWGRQISHLKITAQEISLALQMIGTLDKDKPLSFPVFFNLCRR